MRGFYRAWDEHNKKMLNVGEFDLYHEEDNGLHSGYVMENGDWAINRLMQYTGLKDKNGVDICEGDIIKTSDSYGYVEYADDMAIYELIFTNGSRGLYGYMKYNKQETRHKTGLSEFTLPYRVIGNIYENPELLKSE